MSSNRLALQDVVKAIWIAGFFFAVGSYLIIDWYSPDDLHKKLYFVGEIVVIIITLLALLFDSRLDTYRREQ